MYHQISDKSLEEFKEICEKKGIKYETEQEYRDSAQNLVNYVGTLVEIDQKNAPERNGWKQRRKVLHSRAQVATALFVDVQYTIATVGTINGALSA